MMVEAEKIPLSQKVKILIVDDHPENLLALEAVLTHPLYELVRAESGKEALVRVFEDEFALILLDVQMPVMNGFDVADRIRRDFRSQHVPIIFITAVYTDTQYMIRGYETGAVDYLLKPFEPEILRSKVAVFVDLFLYRKELLRRSEDLLYAERERAREAEKARREQEARQQVEERKRYFEDIVNRFSHSIIWEAAWTGSSLQFRFVSQRASHLLGFSPQRWLKEDLLLQRVHPDDRAKVLQTIQSAIAQHSDQRCEHRMIAEDGKLYWFHTGVQIENSSVVRGLSVEISSLMTERQSAA